MPESFSALSESLRALNEDKSSYATDFVDALLERAQHSAATDVHLQPTRDGLEIKLRVDGALESVGVFPRGAGSDVVSRLKVLAGLLTYRSETPQEGRLAAGEDESLEMRVSTFPTLHGERAVIRIFNQSQRFDRVDDLGLGHESRDQLLMWLKHPSGGIVIAGPAGSGKTTTAYACLREIRDRAEGKRCIVTLEDPIEAAIDGVVQSQVRGSSGFDLDVGLRSLVRQDPEVMMVGEIRDPFAAETVISASLTGHLVLTTFHAEDGAGAISRLLEMGIAPYLIRSGIRAVISQRLVRALCSCAEWSTRDDARLDFAVDRWKVPVGCDHCQGSGYQGRRLLAEFFPLGQPPVRDAILSRGDRAAIAAAGAAVDVRSLAELAHEAIEEGVTSPEEVRRVFGNFAATDGNRGRPG